MDNRRLATMVRRLGDTRTRRGALAGALLALAGPALPLRGVEAQAKRRKKKCKQPKPIPEPRCQEACPGICFGCASRKEGSLLCTDSFITGGIHCSTDNDCVGTGFHYCLTKSEIRGTGDVNIFTVDGQGVCGNVQACVA
jgi:hypothetical protein